MLGSVEAKPNGLGMLNSIPSYSTRTERPRMPRPGAWFSVIEELAPTPRAEPPPCIAGDAIATGKAKGRKMRLRHSVASAGWHVGYAAPL